MTMVEEYANKIPLIVRKAFNAYATDNRSAIATALYYSGGRLSFNQLKSILEIDQRTLANELKKLRNGAIIVHYTEFIEGKKENSFYDLTEFGTDFLKSAIKVYTDYYTPAKTKEPIHIDASSVLPVEEPDIYATLPQMKEVTA